MTQERLNEKKASRNGWQRNAGLPLQAPALCCPACRQRNTIGRSGSQVIEYALLIAALSAALTTMYVYGKRGLESVIRDTCDEEFKTNTSGPRSQSQIDGLPMAGFMANESTQTDFNTLSGDNSRARVDATGITYETNSFSTSAGVATSHMTGT